MTVVSFYLSPAFLPGWSWRVMAFPFFVCPTWLFPGIDDIHLFLFILASYKRPWLHHCVMFDIDNVGPGHLIIHDSMFERLILAMRKSITSSFLKHPACMTDFSLQIVTQA